MVTGPDMIHVHVQALKEVYAVFLPVCEPFKVSARLTEEFKLHLLELSGSEGKVTRSDFVSEGFTNCDEVVEKLNLSYDDNQQIEAGQYQLTKILRQYRKKYKDKKLKEMCYKYLFSKGFNSEVITNLLERNLQDDN